ncbi:uncharacterized protein LAJ45_09590 [Morchella importuna]|uniref:uncharacterized protein n=1 Tax=Morchella importuna TaxID=1174673 RepID=UPI001E8E08AA|nr:uncharacterized protein LAJ45_09590 [Morchella importuna]KAH8146397.1 hypothetical protein LAJ45_09590 [Morchella importuna]
MIDTSGQTLAGPDAYTRRTQSAGIYWSAIKSKNNLDVNHQEDRPILTIILLGFTMAKSLDKAHSCF